MQDGGKGGGGGQIANLLGKNPQVHLIIVREWPPPPPILRNLDNSPPGAFIWPSPNN